MFVNSFWHTPSLEIHRSQQIQRRTHQTAVSKTASPLPQRYKNEDQDRDLQLPRPRTIESNIYLILKDIFGAKYVQFNDGENDRLYT